jgi:hypothetical protein
MSMAKVVAALSLIFLCHSINAQKIQWNYLLLPGEVHTVAKDSSEKSMAVFKSRLFLYDSLQRISHETGTPFFEYDYIAEFKKPQEVSQLVIQFKGASRLIYSIRLYDEHDETHTVYNYGAIHACDPNIETLLLTVAHTPYLVKKVELGTFVGQNDVMKIGLSAEQDQNKVIQELVSLRYKSICNQASYFNDKIELGTNINSTSFEVKPVIAPDGKTLYFHRQNWKDNVGGKKDDQDIYVSHFTNGDWSSAQNIGAPLNDNLPNGIASVSSGETSLFLINEYLGTNQQKQGLSFSEKTMNGWSFPKNIEVKNYYNRSEYMDYFVSPTQNEMILAIQRDDSYGDQDLYVSFYDDASTSWTEPVNLGPEVNSVISEASPFLAADGKTLYFASNGFLGYGGFDIYVTHRLDDSWTKWSYPENLGPVINSFDDDLYYTVSAAGDQAYFVSTINNDRNIFKIPLPTIYKPEPVVLVSGKILNATDGAPKEGSFTIRWHNDAEVIGSGKSDPATGEYKIVLPTGGVFDYVVSGSGVEQVSGIISTLKARNYEEKRQDILVGKELLRNSDPIVLEGDEQHITNTLQNIATLCRTFPEYTVIIKGAPNDSIDSAKGATFIKGWLLKNGVDVGDITEETGTNARTEIILTSDSISLMQQTSIPEDYIRPTREATSDISLLVKGKVIDALTFKPVAARIAFKENDKIKSRSSSDPFTGNFQALLPAGSTFDVTVFLDTVNQYLKLTTPNVNNYQEVNNTLLLNQDKFTKTSFEIGSGISGNRNAKDQARFNKSIRKKKASRAIIGLKDTTIQIAERIQTDLQFLAEVMKQIPTLKATIITHTSKRVQNTEAIEEAIGNRCAEYLINNGVNKANISIQHAGATVAKHAKPKHHTNNRVDIQMNF